jgi:TonB family protein
MCTASDPNSKARFAATCSTGIRRQVMKHIFGIRFSSLRACMVMGLLAIAQPAFAQENWSSRVARLNYVQGDVSFQPGGESDWGWATPNRPLITADSLWTSDRSKAELHIGSTAIRVDQDTALSFLNLDDNTVQIQLNSGTLDVRVRNFYGNDIYEIDTPNVAFTMMRRGDYRITVDPEGSFTTVTVRDGQGQITGGGQAFLVDANSQVQASGTDYISYDVYDLPRQDAFDRWSYLRSLREDHSRSARYVSPEVTGYEDLDQSGTWRTDPNLGPVWTPTRVSRDWAPFRYGHWAWVDQWGWTWVDDSPSGFVTSHYGRWAHLNGAQGGNWAWVPPRREQNDDSYQQRPVYSPALVTFVGDSNASRDFGNGGGVGWVPLAPGEVYVPSYTTNTNYITQVNITNTVVQQTVITNVVNHPAQINTYANQRVVGAVTAVPKATFVNAQPVARAAVVIAPSAVTAAPIARSAPPVAPVKASVMGGNTAVSRPSSPPPRPPAPVISRPVVAKVAPPPPPVPFAQKQQALAVNPGKPLDARTVQSLRPAAPPVVRVVKTAPPAAVVMPAAAVPKKPQPAISPNTAQQVHPAAPPVTAPGANAGAQQAAQQQAEKLRAQQAAAQQQAAQQQAQKAQQAAAQQQAAQQQAAQQQAQKVQQQAGEQKAAQQQAAEQQAEKVRAQQASAQQAAQQQAEKVHAQQAAAQQAAQQQAQKDQQQAASQKAAQQQAAQQQAEKVRAQQAAAQQAAQQKAAQQQAAQQEAQKAQQAAAQQQAAQARPPSNPPNARPPANTPANNSQPLRVAENVQSGKLVSQPKLNVPADAKNIHGVVRVQALIGTDGKVKNASVLSGPQPLQAAALENVRQRQYQPTMANGTAVQVETEVSISF